MIKKCKVCKEDFKVVSNGKYCSITCFNKMKSEKIKQQKLNKRYQKECLACKNKFLATRVQKLCSDKCKYVQQLQRNTCWQIKTNYQKNNYKINREKILARYYRDRDKISKQRKEYRKNNRNMLQNRDKKYYQYRKQTDINYKLRKTLRDRINAALRNNYKQTLSLELIGCTVEQLKKYLQKQFKQGMKWENHGMYGWHIDHIIPCVSFDLSRVEEQRKCFHYTNLQPLWANENLRKNRFEMRQEKTVEA